jgi:membrane associated rhomboid family serine protease
MKVFPKATAALIAANVAIFLLQLLWGGGNPAIVLYPMGAMVRDAVIAGEWWRLVSSAFLHVAIWHVAANMYVLYLLGSFLEIILGSARFLVLYALSALGGGLAVQFFSGPGAGAGASGAVWGLMTAYLVLAYKPGEALGPEFARRMRRTGWINVLLNLGISFVPGISMSAHLGGGAFGALLALSGLLTRGIAREREFPPDGGMPVVRGSAGWRLLAGLSVLLMAGCVAAAIFHGRPWELRKPQAHVRVSAPCGPLSLEIPASLQPQPAAAGEPACVRAYGTLQRDPMVIEIEITPHGGASEVSSQVLAQIKTDLERETLPQDFSRVGPVVIVPLEGGAAVVESLRITNGATARQWVTDRRGDRVAITVVSSPNLPASWSGEADRVIGTLQMETK